MSLWRYRQVVTTKFKLILSSNRENFAGLRMAGWLDGWMACLETNYDQDTEAEPTSNTIDFELCDRNENSPAKNIKLSSRQSEE